MNFSAQIAKLVDGAQAIRSAANAAGRELTDEELSTIEANMAEVAELKAKQDRHASAMKQLEAANASLAQAQPRKTAVQPSASVQVSEPEWKKDPKKGFASHKDFIMAVQTHGNRDPRAAKDERLQFLAAAGSDENQTDSDPYGGFLVPTGLMPGVMQIEPESDPTSALTMKLPMETPSINVNARVDKDHSTSVAGGLTVSRKDETGAGTATRMKFEQINLKASSLFGAAYATEELLVDSPSSFAALVAQGFEQAFVDHLLNEKINGSGVGEFQGVVNSGAFISIAKESAQTADTIVGANITKMRARCWGYKNAVWLANHDTYNQLLSAHIAGTNGDIFLFNPSTGEDVPDMLLGRPIIFTEYTKTLGDANDLLLVNWTQYLEGLYQPMQSAESIHVRFLNNERTFKFWLRNDGKSWWTSALTPRNSSNTLSPFVGLAERA